MKLQPIESCATMEKGAQTMGPMPRPGNAVVIVAWCLVVVLAGGCAARVSTSEPPVEAVARLGCVAVLPFANHSRSERAGDVVAEMVAGSLVLSNRYNIVEPAEVRGLLDMRGIALWPAQNSAAARTIGEALGVDAVLMGDVVSYGDSVVDAVVFSTHLVDVGKGEIVWSGRVTHSGTGSGLTQPVLTGFAQRASDELLAILISRREPPAAHGLCAKPKAPVLATRTLHRVSAPAASTNASGDLPASPDLSSLPDLPPVQAKTTPEEKLHSGLQPPHDHTTAADGAAASLALPPLPDLPAGPDTRKGTDRAHPPAGDTSDLQPLPALPSLDGASIEPLPALPPAPDPSGGSGLTTNPLPDVSALPDLPDLAALADNDASAGGELEDLPYMPAAPETPPAPKGKISGRQRALLRQLYVGTGVIRRFFKTGSPALQRKANGIIADFLGLLKAAPDLKLAFEVHADVGTAPGRSQQLSERQLAVLQKLVESRYPIARGRVFFRSLGNGRPIAKDVSARARAQNTRVEIRRVY